jgi:hypothetical protein
MGQALLDFLLPPSIFFSMSYPPVLDIQFFNRAKDNRILGTPSADEAIKAAMRVINSTDDDTVRGHHLNDGLNMIESLL